MKSWKIASFQSELKIIAVETTHTRIRRAWISHATYLTRPLHSPPPMNSHHQKVSMFERFLYINLHFHIVTGKGLYPNEHLISAAKCGQKIPGCIVGLRWRYDGCIDQKCLWTELWAQELGRLWLKETMTPKPAYFKGCFPSTNIIMTCSQHLVVNFNNNELVTFHLWCTTKTQIFTEEKWPWSIQRIHGQGDFEVDTAGRSSLAKSQYCQEDLFLDCLGWKSFLFWCFLDQLVNRESYLSATKLDATWVIGFNVWRCKRSRAALQHEKCYPRHGTPSFFVEIYSWLDRLVVMMYDVSQRWEGIELQITLFSIRNVSLVGILYFTDVIIFLQFLNVSQFLGIFPLHQPWTHWTIESWRVVKL